MIISRFFRSRRVLPALWAVHPGAGRPLADRPASPRADGDIKVGATNPSIADSGAGAAQSANTKSDTIENNPDDLRDLVINHGDAVYRLARSIVRDSSLAEDVTQDTMLKAWLALPGFRGESSLRGWIMRIAHNTAISTLRARKSIVIDPADLPEKPSRPELSTANQVENSQAVDAFVDALDLLDDLSRSILVLREIEGMAYDEISNVLGVPLPTVKTRLLRARRRLGTALREWE